jgi:nitroreductase
LTHRGEETGKFILKIPEPDNPEDLYATRRSIRHYTSQKVEPDVLQKLMYLAETAPSGHNARKRQYHIVDSKAAIDKVEAITTQRYRRLAALINPVVTGFLSVVAPRKARSLLKDRKVLKRLVSASERGHHPFFRGAPCAIFISAPKTQRTGREDCTAAQQILILNAHRLGLGTCIIGFALYAHKELEKFLNLPKNRRIYAVTVLGYPKYNYRKAIYRGDGAMERRDWED